MSSFHGIRSREPRLLRRSLTCLHSVLFTVLLSVPMQWVGAQDDTIHLVAHSDRFVTYKGSALKVHETSILKNDVDSDGDLLAAIIVDQPKCGRLLLKANGQFVYYPEAGFVGLVSFTYKASDGFRDSKVTSVTIMVKDADMSVLAVKRDEKKNLL